MTDSKERIQLNLRLDGHRELYDAVKASAAEQDTSVNQFVINALKAALGWEVNNTSMPTQEALENLIDKMLDRKLDERLGETVAH